MTDGDTTPAVLRPPRLPPAAASPAVANLFLLTLLSTVDGTLLLLAASGQLGGPGGAVAVGLTLIAGAGSWLAAHQAYGARARTRRDWATLAVLAAATMASTVASVWLGARLGTALTLHVLPKAAGVVLFLVAAEVAGLRLPRPGRVPLALHVLGAGLLVEVALVG